MTASNARWKPLPAPRCHGCNAWTMKHTGSVIEPEGTQLDYYVCARDGNHRTALRRSARFRLFRKPEPLRGNAAEDAVGRARAHKEAMELIAQEGWTKRPK